MARRSSLLRPISVTLLALLILGTSAAIVLAQGDETLIEYRQRLMKGHSASMGSIGDILKYKLEYTEHIATHAKNIHEFSQLIESSFKKEIAAGATDAKSEIWQDWDTFVAKAKTLGEQSAKLAEVAAGGDMKAIMPAVRDLGLACRGCHDNYRKPKEESYKSQ